MSKLEDADGRGTGRGSPEGQQYLTIMAEERAMGVMADPGMLRKAGAAVPLLAVVNQRCGDQTTCLLKYPDMARELNVSTGTVKAWAEALEEMGFCTRTPRRPAGVEIRLCVDMWPRSGVGMAHQLVDTINAVRLTVDRVLDSAAGDIGRMFAEPA